MKYTLMPGIRPHHHVWFRPDAICPPLTVLEFSASTRTFQTEKDKVDAPVGADGNLWCIALAYEFWR
jgi:hypothetical protein